MLISSRCEFMMQLTARFSQLTVSDIDMENALCYIITSEPKGGVDMKLSVEQITRENEEEVIVRCYDTEEKWVEVIRAVTAGEVSVSAFAGEKVYRLKLSDVYYFEVVDGCSFLYCERAVFKCRQKLYEFEELCRSSMLFRCSKSMILNADKIQYVRPSVSGRFEATLANNEKVIISRQYVGELKRLLGV